MLEEKEETKEVKPGEFMDWTKEERAAHLRNLEKVGDAQRKFRTKIEQDEISLGKRLAEFYDLRGISSIGFRCSSRAVCSAKAPQFTEAKASFVGPRYEEGTLPRLLFLSLDSGRGHPDRQQRTVEAVRRQALDCDVEALPKNLHWYRTHQMAFDLLCQFKPHLTIEDTRLHFAHVNSAKCCQNKPGRKRADSTLFENCRRFIPGELRILEPDVVVTQGDPARDAIRKSYDVRRPEERTVKSDRRRYQRDACYQTGLIELEPDGKLFLWLHTFHPSNFGRFNPQRAHCWRLYAEDVGRYWCSSRKPGHAGQKRKP
ncbi:MAG: hypothetical protein OXN23_08400 [Gammaproteobacteria bacterium]|nr:hypothetical protein [Gammaproteobacteria bacterium]